MDPDCAICHAPATAQCDCEAKGLDMAVKQAEQRMMTALYNDIRQWVRAHAQDYILEYFRLLTERRKTAHTTHLDRITAHAYYHYHQPPHPSQIAEAQQQLKRGIDEDWQASVQRYPEVLEYFFSLVELTLPSDDDPTVKDPPLSGINGHRKPQRRATNGGQIGSGGSAGSPGGSGGPAAQQPPALPQPQMDPRDPFGMMRRGPSPPQPPMSVPPPGAMMGMERTSRTPGPPGDRHANPSARRVQYRHHAAPPPPQSYYGAPY
jgi:hypothetical protein